MTNIGSILVALIGLAVCISILILLSRRCSHKISSKIMKLMNTIKEKLMFNSILRYFLTQFFKITLATSFNIRLIVLAVISPLNLMLAIPTLLMLLSFTIFTYVFMQKN